MDINNGERNTFSREHHSDEDALATLTGRTLGYNKNCVYACMCGERVRE